jgi:cytoskeletal protein CcmA (bactofilin family)
MTRNTTITHVTDGRRHVFWPISRVPGVSGSGLAFAFEGHMRWHLRNRTAVKASTAFISEGSELVGTCSFEGSVVINGRIKGEIQATGTLTIGRAGRVEARLHAPIVIIEGELVGSVVAAERIELREGARVHGDLETPALVIEESAVFEGQTKSMGGHGGAVRGDSAGDPRLRATATFVAEPS